MLFFGSVLCQIPKGLVIVSDDAGQFNILNHALCWIHAERTLAKLIVPSTIKQKILEDIREEVWQFYDELKLYKESPNQKDKFDYKKNLIQFLPSKQNSNSLISPWNVFTPIKMNFF